MASISWKRSLTRSSHCEHTRFPFGNSDHHTAEANGGGAKQKAKIG
jgi:hypothetical protein